MSKVELIYEHDCPNVDAARKNLQQALGAAAWPVRWTEWDRADEQGPPYVRQFGSPTVLVAGRDVAGVAGAEDVSCCRLYRDATGAMANAPPTEQILAALRAADDTHGGTDRGEPTGSDAPGDSSPAGGAGDERRNGGWTSLAALPAMGAAALPVGFCPACWPAYAAVLGAVGLGPMLYAPDRAPVIGVLLLLAVAGLAWGARRRRGYGPAMLGALAMGVIGVGKFVFLSDLAGFSGMGLLLAATLWNAWPRGAVKATRDAGPSCAPRGSASPSSSPIRGATENPS